MKKILLALLILFSFSAKANTVIIGSGSGSISKTSMGTLNPGDTLAITAGTYNSGILLANLHDITIINYGGVVYTTTAYGWDVGGGLYYGAGKFFYNVTFTGSGTSTYYGFVFSNMGSTSPISLNMSTTVQGFYGLRFERMHFLPCSAPCFNLYNNGNTYNGNDTTLKLHNASFRYLLADSTQQLISSSENPTSDFLDSVDIHDCTVNQPQDDGEIVTATIFRFNIYNNVFSYRGGIQTVTGDIGKCFLLGNGQFHHNYIYGGRGYMLRIIIAGLQRTVTDTYVYDNVELATTEYGGVDVRGDSAANWSGSPYLIYGNVHIINNTIGNKTVEASNQFTTSMLVLYAFQGAVELKNNLAFNDATPGSYTNTIITNFTSNTISDSSQNRTLTGAQSVALLLDTINYCVPQSTASSLNGQGIYKSYITTDVQYHIRPNPPSIGAAEYFTTAGCNCINIKLGYRIAPKSGTRSYNRFKGRWLDSLAQCKPPTITVPSAPTVTLPTNSITLSPIGVGNNGSGISSWKWRKMGGSGNTLDSSSQKLIVTNLASGFSIWQCKATDSCGVSDSAQIIVTVNSSIVVPPPPVFLPPTVISVFNESLAKIVVYATDPNPGGSIVSYSWTKVSGPGMQTLYQPDMPEVIVSGLQNGTYQFQCIVTNSEGKTTTYFSNIIINIH